MNAGRSYKSRNDGDSWLEKELLALLRGMDRLERVLAVLGVVSGSDVELLAADVRGHNLQVAVLLLDALEEVLELEAQLRPAGKPERQAGADGWREGEEFELLTDLAVVALLGFLEEGEILVEHLLLREGDAVEARQLLAFLVAPPIGPSHAQDLDGLDVGRVGNVRPTAKVGERALRIGRDGAVGQLADQLRLVDFAPVSEELQGVGFRDVGPADGFLLAHQLGHLSLDLGEIAFLDDRLARIHVIIEPVLDGGADTELDAGIQLLQGFGHEVSARVPKGVLALVVVPLQQAYRGVGVDGAREVPCLSIDARGQDFLRQARADALRDFHRGRPFRVFSYGIVRECNLDHKNVSLKFLFFYGRQS